MPGDPGRRATQSTSEVFHRVQLFYIWVSGEADKELPQDGTPLHQTSRHIYYSEVHGDLCRSRGRVGEEDRRETGPETGCSLPAPT